jgi:hypothetical protein
MSNDSNVINFPSKPKPWMSPQDNFECDAVDFVWDSTHPDYKGSINIGSNDFWLSAWVSTSKSGDKYLSLSARPKTESKNPAPKAESKKIDFNDEIPW